jgi:adenylate cyclase
VFEVLKPNIVGTEEALRNLIGEFEEGRKAYRQMDWPKCRRHFESCLAIRPDDGPSKLYLERLAEYEKEPPVAPGEQWDGVYTFKHK